MPNVVKIELDIEAIKGVVAEKVEETVMQKLTEEGYTQVIRCNECRHYEADLFQPTIGVCCHPEWSTKELGFTVSGEGYCYRGERGKGKHADRY